MLEKGRNRLLRLLRPARTTCGGDERRGKRRRRKRRGKEGRRERVGERGGENMAKRLMKSLQVIVQCWWKTPVYTLLHCVHVWTHYYIVYLHGHITTLCTCMDTPVIRDNNHTKTHVHNIVDCIHRHVDSRLYAEVFLQDPSLIPRPLPDFISQLWWKVGSGLGMKLARPHILRTSWVCPVSIKLHATCVGLQYFLH